MIWTPSTCLMVTRASSLWLCTPWFSLIPRPTRRHCNCNCNFDDPEFQCSYIGKLLYFVRVPTRQASDTTETHRLLRPSHGDFCNVSAMRLAVIEFYQRLPLQPPAHGRDVPLTTPDVSIPSIQRFDPSLLVIQRNGEKVEGIVPSTITNKCCVTSQAPYYAIPYTQLTQSSRR